MLFRSHGAELVGEGVGPEVGQQHAADQEEEGAVAGAAGRLHLGYAGRLHVELQDHDGKHDQAERKQKRRPRLHFTLKTGKQFFVCLFVFGLVVRAFDCRSKGPRFNYPGSITPSENCTIY